MTNVKVKVNVHKATEYEDGIEIIQKAINGEITIFLAKYPTALNEIIFRDSEGEISIVTEDMGLCIRLLQGQKN